jgi:Ni/Co efflux regulator RcnB
MTQMKKILLATIALSMFATPAAFAQQYRGDRDQGRGHGGYEQQHRQPQMKKQDYRKRWSKGQRVPSQARGNRVDYKRHHLKAPPRGYQWVENDGQYLMIGIASGLIAAIANAGR